MWFTDSNVHVVFTQGEQNVNLKSDLLNINKL